MEGNNVGKIKYTLPSHNGKNNNANLTEEKIKLKDQLMKLIIDTKDEAIELKINGEQYRRMGIHDEWRQVAFGDNKEAYFSYQEKAAKDFIFRFNKCGILSDQVGMGKTIEAGMVISELAYRKELGSLLILVPNENMAEKWETELARKFGFRNYYKDLEIVDGREERKISYEDLPKVKSVKSLSDLYSLIYSSYEDLYVDEDKRLDSKLKNAAYEAYDEIVTSEKFQEIREKIISLTNHYKRIDSKEFKMEVLKNIFAPLIQELVTRICTILKQVTKLKKYGYEMSLSGNYYHIVDMYLDTPITSSILANGIMERLIDRETICNSIIYEFDFLRASLGEKIIERINLDSKNASNDVERLSYIDKFRGIASRIREKYTVLIVSKIVTEGNDEQFNLLNYCLNEDFESESTRYCSESSLVERGYYFIDMLIDMNYKTLIVDEAHDYIKVSHKLRMSDGICKCTDYEERQRNGIEFADLDLTEGDRSSYFVFPLYNDYYFIEKNCLYLKVKSLADRSYRKIFMTATPIKSDMIDFYLLYLLADNSDTNTYNKIRKLMDEEMLSQLVNRLMDAMTTNQKRALNYCTHEDIVIRYIYEAYRKNESLKIKDIIEAIINEGNVDKEIIKEICINRVRLQFQETFTIKDLETNERKEINSISDLVSSDEGIEQWQNMYSQVGIRSTRHQTFRLDEEHLKLIKASQRDKYRNLPIWSRRNGTIVYIHKKDNFFDLIVKEMLDDKKNKRVIDPNAEEKEIRNDTIDIPKARDLSILEAALNEEIESLDNEDYTDKVKEMKIKEAQAKFDRKVEDLENKYAPKETAMDIYAYINQQLTGTLHMADYYSTDVDYDDFKLHMVCKLMTDGLEIQDEDQPKKISGKVLLFADESTQGKVLKWLTDEETKKKNWSDDELTSYISRYKHQPLWYYNSLQENEEDKWVITTDIKALKEKKGNYLIVVEPNKYEEGVDLQTSNTLINFDIKFCPLKMEQRIGRIDRVKLTDEQTQLDIISFTPINDMSGFMVDFLVNDLQMFSCWKGDTTGIVSMPLGEKPNSATFESAILAINEAYKNLYNYNSKSFIASLKRIVDLGQNFDNPHFKTIEELCKNESKIHKDFEYLRDSNDDLNNIIFNSECTDREMGDNGFVLFNDLCVLAEDQAVKNGVISKESISNHKNDLNILRKSIDNYYKHNINKLDKELTTIKNTVGKNDNSGMIATVAAKDQEIFDMIKMRKDGFENEYEIYKKSKLCNLLDSVYGLEKEEVDKALNPILNRFRGIIEDYLNALLELFDSFCEEVSKRSKKMTKFISYLTIEEFKVMAENYE